MVHIEESIIAQIVRDVLSEMPQPPASRNVAPSGSGNVNVTAEDYPLFKKHPELIQSNTGKSLEDITLQAVMDGKIGPEDVRISPETLHMQAQIAESVGRNPLAENFRRAQELISVPDGRILEMYNALRPFRSTKKELLAIANELESQYGAGICADLVREAAQVYEKRNYLRAD